MMRNYLSLRYLAKEAGVSWETAKKYVQGGDISESKAKPLHEKMCLLSRRLVRFCFSRQDTKALPIDIMALEWEETGKPHSHEQAVTPFGVFEIEYDPAFNEGYVLSFNGEIIRGSKNRASLKGITQSFFETAVINCINNEEL